MLNNQHSAPSLDFSSIHEDAIGSYHSQNAATAVAHQQIILRHVVAETSISSS
jgi:hypothetical protein